MNRTTHSAAWLSLIALSATFSVPAMTGKAATGQASAAQARNLPGARALIDRIYSSYARDQAPATQGIFTPELQASIARQSGPEDLGLGYDPFCQCQDFDSSFRYRILALDSAPGGAVARVEISNFGETKVVTVRLSRRGTKWLVGDIVDGTDSLLRGG